MSPVSRTRPGIVVAFATALLLAGLLPATVLAVGPTAVDDEFTIPVNSGVTNWAVMDNDIGTSLDLLETLTTPEHGVAFVNGTHVHYTPDTDFHGTDTFDYTIDDGAATDVGTVTVIVNTAPVAVDDPGVNCGPNFGGGFPVPEDYRFAGPPADTFVLFGSCSLLHNDTDADGDTLTYEILTQPVHGQADKIDEDFFTYKADPDYGTQAGSPPATPWELDTFTYRAFDGLSYSEPATMSFWVAAINDPPTFTPGPAIVSVSANSGAYSATWATDVSPGPFGESAQTVQFLPDGPNAVDDGGLDLFAVPPAIDGSGVLTFTLNPDVIGVATVTFVAKDDGGLEDYGLAAGTMVPPDDTTDAFSFQIAVTTVNHAPAGADKTVSTMEDTALTFAGSDFGFSDTSDVPPGLLAGVKITTLPSAGALRNNNVAVIVGQVVSIADITAGRLKFNPALNGNGTGYTSFTFQVQDDGGTANGGIDLDPSPNTMTLDVTAVNDAPNAVNDAGVTVPEGAGPTYVAVLANDIDPDGDTMTITAKTNGTHGAVAITGGGTGLTYDPVSRYHGTDVFTYTVSDGNGKTDTATVLVTIPKDTTKPIVVAPAQRFPGQTVATTTTKVRLGWSGSDPGSGIVKYQLQASVNGGTFANVTLASATSTTIDRTLTTGATYRFRVRATDFEGNTSGYQYGPTFKVLRFQESSSTLTWTGAWNATTSASMLGGHGKSTTSTTRRVTFSNYGSDFAWIATRTATSGSAQVWVDGVLVTTVNLRSSSTLYRQLVFARHFTTPGAHTVEIRPMGGGRVDIDAFTVLR
jgi:hypothetical protein